MSDTRTVKSQLPHESELRVQVNKLLAAAEETDGVAPLSEQFVLGLGDARLGHQHFIATRGDDQVVGVLADDGDSAEMAVAPSARRAGVGTALLEESGARDVWAHGNLPAAQALAGARSMKPTRTLLVMAVAGDRLRENASVPGVEGTFLNYDESVSHWGREHVDAEWLRVNNEAFDWHPEQGGWDAERLDRAREAEWYDPRDVIFLWDEVERRLEGFHWTKWHTEADAPFGEVYVVGLAADYRGKGLGGPLIAAGLRRMVEKGADRVILYVEADNEPAVKAYENLGFSTAEEHVVYSAA